MDIITYSQVSELACRDIITYSQVSELACREKGDLFMIQMGLIGLLIPQLLQLSMMFLHIHVFGPGLESEKHQRGDQC
jgi:D-arabinose 1-dehydrogenase-like Zn-dependent alcohol dehydrogenase